MVAEGLRYRRVLVKLSGEALMGEREFGLSRPTLGALTDEIVETRSTGLPLGMFEDQHYSVQELSVEPGDLLLLEGDLAAELLRLQRSLFVVGAELSDALGGSTVLVEHALVDVGRMRVVAGRADLGVAAAVVAVQREVLVAVVALADLDDAAPVLGGHVGDRERQQGRGEKGLDP